METNMKANSNNVLKENLLPSTLKKIIMPYRHVFILLFQIFVTAFSFLAAFHIRFDFHLTSLYLQIFFKSLPLLLISRVISNYYFKIHAGSWQFVSMRDLMDVFKAVMTGSVLFMIMMVFVYRIEEFPRSVFILEGLLNVILMGGSRFIIRYYSDLHSRRSAKILKYVLIVGAGKAGVMMLNEIRNNTRLGIQVLGFIDDDPYKKGMNIQGVPVLGNTEGIPRLVTEDVIDEVIIAIPSARYKDIVRISEICETAQVKAQVLPNMEKLFDGSSYTSQLREVSYDNLLGRKIIKFSRESDRKRMEAEIKEKAVLVTGAGGSIGSELCRQVAEYGPRTLILYDRYENSLYDLELDLKRDYPGMQLIPIIGDILDAKKVDNLLQHYAVELVYHAAAYKHVPLMEREPIEAVRNNIIGTLGLAKLAVKNKIQKFVLISTDKAVNPANIMGTTKRVAELIIQSLNSEQTKFVAVRFGNVIGSNGSVIPLFKKQIAKGGPITVTDPEITRYFMAIPEAVQLVMTAGAMAEGGEIFLLDMGDPIKIVDLAKELIKLSGLEPGKDIDIVFSGLRPGEKLFEELYWKGEGVVPTKNKKINMLKQDGVDHQDLSIKIQNMNELVGKGDVAALINILKDVVPESTIKSMNLSHHNSMTSQDSPSSNTQPSMN
jgi:FlaA1/EpsC-like NDP-sugar epimerase